MKNYILVEWIDADNLYHSGAYPNSDKRAIEIKLNSWLTDNKIKSYDIKSYEGIL